jgi:hypothetical protein
MAKLINSEKVSNKPNTIERESYEYLRDEVFSNTTLIVAAISIYATFAYITISYLRK